MATKYTATSAYEAFHQHHGTSTVYEWIQSAVSQGQGHIFLRGFLPPSIIEDLRDRGYLVATVDVSTLSNEAREQTILIQWAHTP